MYCLIIYKIVFVELLELNSNLFPFLIYVSPPFEIRPLLEVGDP